jgi:hypothetical protein
MRVQPVGELGLYPGGLKQKGQGSAPGRQSRWQALGIALRLDFNAFEGGAFFFGFDHAAGFAVHIEQVVGKTVPGIERKFADGHALCAINIGVVQMADLPTGLLKQTVDVLAGEVFWLHERIKIYEIF